MGATFMILELWDFLDFLWKWLTSGSAVHPISLYYLFRITWEESLKDRLSTIRLSCGDYLAYIHWSRNTCLLWVSPFPSKGLLNSKHELTISKQSCILCSLFSITNEMWLAFLTVFSPKEPPHYAGCNQELWLVVNSLFPKWLLSGYFYYSNRKWK